MFALLQNLMPKAALDMAMFTKKKGKIQSLCPRNMMFLLVVILVEVVVVGKAFTDTFHTKESLLKSKAKAQQDLGNDGCG